MFNSMYRTLPESSSDQCDENHQYTPLNKLAFKTQNKTETHVPKLWSHCFVLFCKKKFDNYLRPKTQQTDLEPHICTKILTHSSDARNLNWCLQVMFGSTRTCMRPFKLQYLKTRVGFYVRSQRLNRVNLKREVACKNCIPPWRPERPFVMCPRCPRGYNTAAWIQLYLSSLSPFFNFCFFWPQDTILHNSDSKTVLWRGMAIINLGHLENFSLGRQLSFVVWFVSNWDGNPRLGLRDTVRVEPSAINADSEFCPAKLFLCWGPFTKTIFVQFENPVFLAGRAGSCQSFACEFSESSVFLVPHTIRQRNLVRLPFALFFDPIWSEEKKNA